MAIVINEFEVVPGEAQPSPPARASQESEKGASHLPSPWEIEHIVEHQLERCERVWAH